MEYASFEPLPEDKLRRQQQEAKIARTRWDNITKYVRDNNLVSLQSDYLDMSTFWLDPQMRILQVQSHGDPKPIFYVPEARIYRHIAALNNLSVPADVF